MKKVLFVCTANTCRSSMAEGIARKVIEEKEAGGLVEFSSAGIFANPGEGAAPEALEILKYRGIDLSGHKSRRIAEDLIRESDIILTMTSSHKNNLISMNPLAEGKTYTLKEYVDGRDGDIEDPFGGDLEVYRKCALEIDDYVKKAVNKIIDI